MKSTIWLKPLLAIVILVGVGTANAQTPSDNQVEDQADVWALVEQQWTAEERGDDKWLDKLLTEDFSGWGNGSPAPQNKTSTKMWNRFNERISQMVAHELYPLSIVVHGDVAVAHYLYTSANEQKKKDGGIKTVNGRYTDILVRTDEGWKFLAWSGGEDD
jgi:ketosteroid isomerase-like protein